jgi:hypothetical protein
MKQFLLTLIILQAGLSFSQDKDNYRFTFGISGLTIMNYGITDLKNIKRPEQITNFQVYNSESYDLDYQNFAFSYGYSLNLSTHIINNTKYSLKANASFFFDKRTEELTYTLVDIGNGEEIENQHPESPYTSEHIGLGYSNTITFGSNGNSQRGGGYAIDLIFSKKLKQKINLGTGVSYIYYNRDELMSNNNGYLMNYGGRGAFRYYTNKIGLLIQIEKQFGRFNTFIKLNQTIITAKKKENYGGTDFNTSDFTLPTSQNLDYRFPLIMDAGLSFNFGKINKK